MQPQQTPTPNAPELDPRQGSIERLPQPITPETKEVKTAPETISGAEKAPVGSSDSADQNAGSPPPATVPQPIVPPATDEPSAVPDDDDTPPIAGDVDLIEKTWVRKAKQVVDQTKDDPYNQNKQINRVKAGYVKKRYNKEIKQA